MEHGHDRNTGITLKPLEGFPMISDNCWGAVLEAFRGRLRSEEEARVLEWGAGNSTISLTKESLASGKRASVTSVEHETGFFPWLAEAVLAEFSKGHPERKMRVTWRPLHGPVIRLGALGKVLAERKALTCPSLKWQILSGNKRLQYTEGVHPDFRVAPLTWLRQSAKLALVELGYWTWLAKGVARSFRAPSSERYALGAPEFASDAAPEMGAFQRSFQANPVAGCLTIEASGVSVALWHLPALKTVFWPKGLLADGPVAQLSDFIGVPVQGKFDLVFIDGRARVSCIKRVHRDKLLKGGGWLFVHDAFRFEMMEGFKLFSKTPTFLHGSNRTLGGETRCADGFGPPMIRSGASFDALELRINQELFFHHDVP